MTSLRIAFAELRRITAGRLPRLAVIAMILIPTLYAGLYLYANHDPYGGLTRVPAALVVDDSGAKLQGKQVDYGRKVADQLLEQGDFDWHEVDRATADAGVEDGTYDFALSIPEEFSASLVSTADFDPQRAVLQMTTNDANSYLSSTIADTVSTKVRDAIAQQVSEQAATTFLSNLHRIRTRLISAKQGAAELADGAGQAHRGATRLDRGAARLERGAGRLARGASRLSDGAGELDDGLSQLEERTATLPTDTRRLADGARQVADGDAEVARYGRSAAQVARDVVGLQRDGRRDLRRVMRQQGLTPAQQRAVLDIYDDLGQPVRDAAGKVQRASDKLDRLSNGADRVADGAEELADAAPQLVSGIDQAASGADQLASGAARLDTGASSLSDGATRLHTGTGTLSTGLRKLDRGSHRLANGLARGVDKLPDVDHKTAQKVASTLGNPVEVQGVSQADAGSYGAGLAPFFLSLGAWIGGYVLFLLIRPLSTRAIAADQAPLRVALGGWYPPAILGVAQMVVVLLVVTFAVGIEPAHIAPTLLFMVLISATFIAIVHALNAWLGPAGQFLGLALMVLQLVTAGGTFPWQTIPPPLHAVHHALPMSYAVDGLRQLMYGGVAGLAWQDGLVLTGWLLAALLITGLAARRQRQWTVSRIKPDLTL